MKYKYACVCINLVIFITILMVISKDKTLKPLSQCGLFILNSDLFFLFCCTRKSYPLLK